LESKISELSGRCMIDKKYQAHKHDSAAKRSRFAFTTLANCTPSPSAALARSYDHPCGITTPN
jgi:hypothetical protein